MIPIHISVRGIILVSLIILGPAIFVIVNNSKEKGDYNKSTGTIEYFDKQFQNLPNRDFGAYRYLKISTYPYLFEIYALNSEPTNRSIDELKVRDKIDIYYYETLDTRNDGLNRFTQFIDSNGESYFIRNGFQAQLGYVIIGLCILMNMVAIFFWKKGRLSW